MPKLPPSWHIHQKPERAPDEELRKLKHRLSAISRRFDRKAALRKLWRRAKTVAVALTLTAAAIAVPLALIKIFSPWPMTTTLRHIASAPNCAAARTVDLAPSRKGQPGYWPSHDADFDGIACEPWPRR
jgi:muconolactone delta-isomerase